MLVLVLIGIS